MKRNTAPASLRSRRSGLAISPRSPHPERYNPDLWTDEVAFLARPGEADIQSDLFYDFRNNLTAFAAWQNWLRERHPPTLVVWGRYDPVFDIAEVEAIKRDVPKAEVHVLDAGHFALDEAAGDIAKLMRAFLGRAPHATQGGRLVHLYASACTRTNARRDCAGHISLGAVSFSPRLSDIDLDHRIHSELTNENRKSRSLPVERAG